jgi:glucuronate isomerase
MKSFLSENFLLNSKTAQKLYFDFAASLPVIDYHCHLPVQEIASNKRFDNLTQIWLKGDHYKWRAMRTLGIEELFITGNSTDKEKFDKWAYTVPYTVRNPLYHWTHMELKRYFGVDELLKPDSSESIYSHCNSLLKTPEFSTGSLIQKMNVEVVCTTDDPVDSLEHHKKIKDDKSFHTKVLPAFRPDKVYAFENITAYNQYINRLQDVCGKPIKGFNDLLSALKNRIDFFHENGCRLADHGLEKIVYTDLSEGELEKAFQQARKGTTLTTEHKHGLTYRLIVELGKYYHTKNWVQQFHLGALRNTNNRMLQNLGPDTGFDSIGDFVQGENLARLLNHLDSSDQLAKTILYNLNPADNELFATMTGNFNDGSVKGKIQYGSAWWFLDQKDGIEKQLGALSNMGLLSCFVGMLTDSRSFLSYPRHEYFRRILCNLIGQDIEDGLLPDDIPWMGKIVSDICYYNAKNYFNF